MQGTILILDGVPTNRIMLKVQLSAAWYRVVQGDRLEGLAALVRRTRPDVIVSAMVLPDGLAADIPRLLAPGGPAVWIPVIAVTPQNDRPARLRALAAGVDDVLTQPVGDMLLQARIRSLIRARSAAEALVQQDGAGQSVGLAEAPAAFEVPSPPGRVVLVTNNPATAGLWQARLKNRGGHKVCATEYADARSVLSERPADALVLDLPPGGGQSPPVRDAGLRLLTDLQARSTTRGTAVIAVAGAGDAETAAQALDRGAQDVLTQGFCGEELEMRLATQLRRKAWSDRMNDNLRDGLAAALTDPMTGLYNRRYAMPRLDRIARKSAETGGSFAVMMADLDHFKRINDQFGHPAGDSVLVETARRLRCAIGPGDMVARVGGEEFMIVQPGAGPDQAMNTGHRLRRRIDDAPFEVPGAERPVAVTISIGVTVAPDSSSGRRFGGDETAGMLIGLADRALYQAKDAGRNRISLNRPAS